MSARTNALINETYQTLKREGAAIWITNKLDKHADPETGEQQGTDIRTTVYGTIKGFGELFTSSTDTNLLKGDVTITISSNAGQPRIGQYAYVGNVPYQILSSRAIKAGDVDVAYVLKARSFQETDVTGEFTKALSKLSLGELVRSDIIDTAPNWRVISHDHFGVGLTLLINDELAVMGAKSFQIQGWPIYPWTETYYRAKVLLESYLPTFDVTFQEDIQPVDVITKNSASSETLFALSKVELGFEADPGSSSGTAIPYFKSDAYRVCRFIENNGDANFYAYWCRDGYGVDGLGKVKILNPSYEHYVRACCNLRGSLQVAKNQDNVWEIQWP
jgi:hypothetical protein